ncbi:MAG: DUF58 domain-containing protein [Phycisphaerales bacterium]|nr:DUF58 domain-containing protein [Phycisphaerales bacterium]
MRIPRNVFTGWSVVLVLATLLVGVGGSAFSNNLLVWLFGVLVAEIILSFLFAWLSLVLISVRRLEMAHGEVGEPLVVRYEVRNRSRWLPAFNIWISERSVQDKNGWQKRLDGTSAWILNAKARGVCQGEAVYWPHKRGPVLFEKIEITTSFPFGIFRMRRSHVQSQQCLIHPEVKPLQDRVLKSLAPMGLLGTGFSQQSGSGDDYYGLREVGVFQPLRMIAWKVSARRENLVGIEKSLQTRPRLNVVLDLRTPTNELEVEGHDLKLARKREEEAITLAASLLKMAQRNQIDTGLHILGLPGVDFGLGHGAWHRLRLTAALAMLDLDEPRREVSAVPGDFERAALIVVQCDLIRPLSGRQDAWYYTASQLSLLIDHGSNQSDSSEEAA